MTQTTHLQVAAWAGSWSWTRTLGLKLRLPVAAQVAAGVSLIGTAGASFIIQGIEARGGR